MSSTKSKRYPRLKIADLDVSRAGSDYLGCLWSISIKGTEFIKGNFYRLVRDDKSSFLVKAVRKENIGWLLVEIDEDIAYQVTAR